MIQQTSSEVLFLHVNDHQLCVFYPAAEGESHRFVNLKSKLFIITLNFQKEEYCQWGDWDLSCQKYSQTDCNVQYVLILPTNLRLHLPWPQCCCEGKPPFLATWPLNRGHAWSHSSLCLEPSGPQWPRRCDEYRSRSRSGNLKNRRRKTIISKIRLQF